MHEVLIKLHMWNMMDRLFKHGGDWIFSEEDKLAYNRLRKEHGRWDRVEIKGIHGVDSIVEGPRF